VSSDRKRLGTLWADSWADDAHLSIRCIAPPVDLHAIARQQRVKRVKLRLMMQLGALVPVPGGFEIFVRHQEPRDLDVGAPEPPKLLNTRQRFTLAHEIAHTLFYKGFEDVPIPNTKLKKRGTRRQFGLEEVCNRVATRLLVPKRLLLGEIRRSLQAPERIDAHFVRAMAAKFRVSADVMLGRLRVVAWDNAFARCIVLVGMRDSRDRVRDSYMGLSLLSAFPPLERGAPLLSWFPELPPSILEASGNKEWQIKRRDREFLLQKFPLGKGGGFLMQIDDLGHKAPGSRRQGPPEGPLLWTGLE